MGGECREGWEERVGKDGRGRMGGEGREGWEERVGKDGRRG